MITKGLIDMRTLALDVFTGGYREGLKRTSLLLLMSFFPSLFLSALLLLYLLYTLACDPAVSGGVAALLGVVLTIALFFSQRVRCLVTLFIISIFTKKTRSLLLTAGTSLVVLGNIHNTLENLTGLVRSMICNLRAKKASVIAPFRNYVDMLKWLADILRRVMDLGVVQLDSHLNITPKVDSEHFKDRLTQAELKLNQSVHYAVTFINTVSSVKECVYPTISFLVLVIFIGSHIRNYCCDIKYKNNFISNKFIQFDKKQKAEGKQHLLPLTSEEEKLYPSLPSLRPTVQEGKALFKFGIPVMSHLFFWVIFITVDALLYCFVTIITTKLSEMEPFHVPLLLHLKGGVTLIGVQLGEEENHHQDFSFSITLFEKQCLPKPKLLLNNSVVSLAGILLTLLIMAPVAAKGLQIRLMVCERFYCTAAEERIRYLHAKILRKRLKKTRENENNNIFKALITKLHFWCPLLFPEEIV
ncbi:dendritic cell-specific transmembrane protein [Syngnathoides biaculeatus]|uniref:dendritic cell-specific transmembrane protein n=1 Tax=Syngnathoides biaculeatus TaxID=300417 RepID=UPI002ADD46FE|nr:dendritic cell-specific transmembrane protein [Syngnathoides biaculeatus]